MTTTTPRQPRVRAAGLAMRLLSVVVVPALLLVACGGTSEDAPDTPARAGDLCHVDGETAHLQCQGSGSPTLVLLGGMGRTRSSTRLHDDDVGGAPRVPGA